MVNKDFAYFDSGKKSRLKLGNFKDNFQFFMGDPEFWEGRYKEKNWYKDYLVAFAITNCIVLGIHLLSIEAIYVALLPLALVNWALAIGLCITSILSGKDMLFQKKVFVFIIFVLASIEGISLFVIDNISSYNLVLALLPSLTIAFLPYALGDNRTRIMVLTIVLAIVSLVDSFVIFPILYMTSTVLIGQWIFLVILIILLVLLIVNTYARGKNKGKQVEERLMLATNSSLIAGGSFGIFSLAAGMFFPFIFGVAFFVVCLIVGVILFGIMVMTRKHKY